VVSHDELNPSQLEELAALDRILAREPVGERHLELAALVDSVRAGAPSMDPAFAERLDARILAGGAPRRARVRMARPDLRRLTFAGGGLVAAAVALGIVISSGVFNGAGHPALKQGRGLTPALATPKTPATSSEPDLSAPGAGPAAGAGAAAGAQSAVGATSQAPVGTGAAGVPSTNFSTQHAGSARLVQRGSTLTLATVPASMQGVANQIVTATERQGGVVESSNVDIQGSASYANFSLQVPSGRLDALIATLSQLASVRALNQGSQDITNGYNQEQVRLADNVAERAALLKQLASAPTTALATSIQHHLDRLETRIAAEHREIDRLLSEGHTATLQVTVVPGAHAKRSAVGPFATAFNRALHALEEILAIALIAFAIILPFALSALALWWGATTVRQRARERAMRTA
jgi:Domain of unknown function (DUF4349)